MKHRFVKPNLFVVGAAKSGTSLLSDLLDQHSEVLMCPVKEPYYFITENDFNDEQDYLRLFKKYNGEIIIGEASTGYLFDTNSPRLIREFCTHAKVIIILRNPIDMSFSFWKYMRIHGNEDLSFVDAIFDIDNRKCQVFKNKCSGPIENYWYLERAKYYQQVKRYLDHFGHDAVKIIMFEDFIADIAGTCSDLFKFLGISQQISLNESVINPGGIARFAWLRWLRNQKYPLLKTIFPKLLRHRLRQYTRDINVIPSKGPEMSSDIRNILRKEFLSDVQKLKILLGDELICWHDFR